MKKKKFAKSTSRFLTVMLVILLLFSTTLSAAPATAEASAGYIKEIDNVITNFKNYLDPSVAYRLPSTIKDNDIISVIVKMESSALLDKYNETDRKETFTEYSLSDEAKELRKEILKDSNKLLSKLSAEGISYEKTGVTYATLLSGFEILITAKDFEKTCKALGKNATAIISEVYNVAETQLVENEVNFDETTGIFDSSDFKYDGSGMVVAVLDTGLDYTHSAFSPSNFTSESFGLTKEEVASVLAETVASDIISGLLADDVYINEKVPFGFDYADKDSDVYSMHNNHGTHVSGVIVGKDDVITGVAPNAQLVSMKIFSDTQDTAKASWILSALEDCVTLGVDVINMSLGTACGFSRESDEEQISGVYQKIRDEGISLIVAASNSYNSTYGSEKNGNLGLTSNPDSATVGSPSTYDGAMSVASINGKKTPYMLYNGRIIYFLEATNSAMDEKEFFADLLPEGTDTKEFEYVLIPGAGRTADYTGIDVTGKIALVRRGSNTFEEKANAAQKQGAAGIIIFNNVAGDIKMNAGTTTIPICSIGQDDGEALAAAGSGKIKVSRSQKSGPFMSDFSSWGPGTDLSIKPEITAHGGYILSAVTGGDYDRLSGTSMACPNTAGVVALLRQYVIDNFADKVTLENGKIDGVAVNSIVNRLLMSTADIVINKNGLPYSVRKQGAGLANLTDSGKSPAYILTYDRHDGSVMDKSKIELGDDPEMTGVYSFKFAIENFGSTSLTYNISAYVMTEGVSETKTHNGETTVSEEGYMLDGATITVDSVAGGSQNKNSVTVGAGQTATVNVTIKLSDKDKKYIEASFANGMYVEGFVILDAVSGTDIDLNVPYLAFYGDWSKAPIFDLDYFETNADELDDSIPTLDKTLADTVATKPIGGVSSDYVSYLGSYYFVQNPNDRIISASRDYIAISNREGTIHSLRFVWAGMLRNANAVEITIVDTATGETVFKTVDTSVRKSYGDGGSIYPTNIDIEFDAGEHNLKNNSQYHVKLQAYLDYDNDGTESNLKNTFEFPLVADFEAPALTDCEFYTEYDKTEKKTKLYARLKVYDNHYSMSAQLGYVGNGTDENGNAAYVMTPFESYMTPIYSKRDTVSEVVFELTDYINSIKTESIHKNTFIVSLYDYALNEATYEVALPDDFIDLYLEESEITLSPNELYTITPLVYPNTEWPELLEYSSSNKSVVRIVNNKIVAIKSGVANVTVFDPVTKQNAKLKVTVLNEGDEGYRRYDPPVADVFRLYGYETIKAFYFVANDERDIGVTGDTTIYAGESGFSLSMFPSESVKLLYDLVAYFPERTTVTFKSSNQSIVSVSDNGTVTANAEGFASITINVLLDGERTYYSKTVSIEVKDPYITNGPSLTHYFGNGGTVRIPKELMLTEIGNFGFSNFDYVAKEAWEIEEDDKDLTKMWYIGENTITRIEIPEGVEKIGAYAFANLTALTSVKLPSTLKVIEYGAFLGCTKLTSIEGLENVKLINKQAFLNCNLTGDISLDSACAISDYAFAGNKNLTSVKLPETLRSIGAYAFANDTKLTSITIAAEKVKLGEFAFAYCEALDNVSINSNVIPKCAFYGCKSLTDITLGKDVAAIGEYAFAKSAISAFKLAPENSVYKLSANSDSLISGDGTTLMLVAPSVSGKYELIDASVTRIGSSAFSGNESVTSVSIPSVKDIGAYAFADCILLREFSFGVLDSVEDYAFYNTAIRTLPSFEGMDKIGKYAFAYTDITSVEIKAGMTVGEGAFCECRRLTGVTVGDGATLGTGAFMLGRDDAHTRYEEERRYNWKIEPHTNTLTGKIDYYYYTYISALKSIVIGADVTIGDSAFMGAAEIESITLGDGAAIGKMAFYNTPMLKEIDLSKAVSIGDMAFSGDVLYLFKDGDCTTPIIKDDMYQYKYYASSLQSVDLSSLTSLGEQAFQYSRELQSVKLGEAIKTVGYAAFENAVSLADINLENVTEIGNYAFGYTALTEISLEKAEKIGEYAFVYCEALKKVALSETGTDLGEGAFIYCSALDTVKNLGKTENIDNYAFVYTAITYIDLTSAKTLGDQVFMKEKLTDVTVIIEGALESLGDNPFAMCRVAPFTREIVGDTFNGKDYMITTDTFDISSTVKVINGSLYCVVPSGLELITYCASDATDAHAVVAEGTVRITAMAFAGSDVIQVTLPHSLNSIGHKAFFDCEKLRTVIFKSYEAPTLEEEFDQTLYYGFQHIPATGDFDFTMNDEAGTEVTYSGLAIVPFYMWNITDEKFSNVYYGASFKDYIGLVDDKLIMIRPSNGIDYETFIYGQYFDTFIDGAVSAQDATLLAIEAISKIPAGVTLKDEALVTEARRLYDLIPTLEQQALVTNLSSLVSAEARIAALKSQENENNGGNDNTDTEPPAEDKGCKGAVGTSAIIISFIGASAVGALAIIRKKKEEEGKENEQN